MTLTTIDRSAPTVTFSTSNVTANGFKISATSSATADYIYGSQEYGGSMTLTTIDRSAPTVTFSTSNVTANGFKISATSSATADIWQYSTNGGSGWTQFSTTAGTSASITLSSLSPNTSYTVKVRARRQYNHVYGTSGSSTVKTLGGAVVNSVNTVTADNATVSITINVTVYEASYTNTLLLKNGGTTILTISGLSWSKGTANRTVTLTSAQRTTLMNAMAFIKSFIGTFAVSSYSGSTQIGSTSSKTATVLTTATNSAPTISGFTYADSYTTTKNLTGNDQLFVQDYSTLKVTPGTATAKNGASISNYTASCNGLSASNSTGAAITVGKIAKSGSVTVTLSVTDSRGYTAETSRTVTVIPYTKPKISSVTLRRTNDIEAEMQLKFSGSISAVTVDGTQKNSVVYVRYRYKKTSESSYGSYTSIYSGTTKSGTSFSYSNLTVDGTQKNSVVYVRYRYKKTSESSYGSYTSIYSGTTKSGTSFSYSNLELCSLDANSSYDLHLQIQDKLYSLSSLDLYFTVPQGTPLIALRKKKVGINTPEPQAMLDVAGDMRVDGSPLADFVIQQGTSGIWNYRKWKSGTAECWGQYSFTTAISTAWGVLYESGAIALPNFPFTFAEIPHVHISTENSNYAMFVERGSSSSWSTTTNPGKIFAVRPNTVPSATYKVSIYAIGKV